MTYEHAVSLAPGHYTIETVVVDYEGARASATILQIDNQGAQPGPELSDIVFVHRIQELQRPPDSSDPFEISGKRATPFLGATLAPVVKPLVYFVSIRMKKSNRQTHDYGTEFLTRRQSSHFPKRPLLPPPESFE